MQMHRLIYKIKGPLPMILGVTKEKTDSLAHISVCMDVQADPDIHCPHIYEYIFFARILTHSFYLGYATDVYNDISHHVYYYIYVCFIRLQAR